MAFSIITLSTLPLAPSFLLLFVLFKHAKAEPLLIKSLRDEVSFFSATQYQSTRGRHKIKKVMFTFLPIGLVIIHRNEERVMLWRDSVTEAKYRELVVMLKREP
ncbi:hypothetical protein [Vibrio sp. TRT 29B02]|uniref:hypothetical protein n=1 Tax=Vibrio sp. TRT 29B02 TaxID=3418508 RepID=UPI003CED393A